MEVVFSCPGSFGCAVVGRTKGESGQKGMILPCKQGESWAAQEVNSNCWDCLPVCSCLPCAVKEKVFLLTARLFID